MDLVPRKRAGIEYNRAECLSDIERDTLGEIHRAGVRDEDVVLEAHAPDADPAVDLVPVHVPGESLPAFWVTQQRLDEVQARFDGCDVAAFEREIHAEEREAEAVGTCAPGQVAAGVADTEADEVPQPVREKERVRVALESIAEGGGDEGALAGALAEHDEEIAKRATLSRP